MNSADTMNSQSTDERSVEVYLDVLNQLAKATSLNATSRKDSTTLKMRASFDSKAQEHILLGLAGDRGLLKLLLAAVGNIMQLVLRETTAVATLLDLKNTIDTAGSLCNDLAVMLNALMPIGGTASSNGTALSSTSSLQQQMLRTVQEVESSGLVSVLTSFTEVVLQSLKHFAASAESCCTGGCNVQADEPQHQQPKSASRRTAADAAERREQLSSRFYSALPLFHILICLWQVLLSQHAALMPTNSCFTGAVAAAVHLAADAVPAFSKVHNLVVTDCGDSSIISVKMLFAAVDRHSSGYLKAVTHNSIKLSVAVLAVLCHGAPAGTPINSYLAQRRQQQPIAQTWQQLVQYAPAQFYNVLTMVLLCQAAGLQRLSGQSDATAASTSNISQGMPELQRPGHSAAASDGQPDERQRQRVLHSHNDCLRHLGLSSNWQQKDMQGYSFHELHCSSALSLLKYLFENVLYCAAVGAGTVPTNSNSITSALAYSTVRLLIEITLLLPAEHIGLVVNSLEVMMLLLQYISASATAGDDLNDVGNEGVQLVAFPSNDRFIGLQIKLPAATAAGLLHPVVQLLSRIVVQTLQATISQQQQHREQKPEKQPKGQQHDVLLVAAESDRLLLLHHFGSLLEVVCQAVEPKHIAAALRSDPVIPLVATEAVIRAQACHLVPNSYLQQLSQKQSSPVATGESEAAAEKHEAVCSTESITEHVSPGSIRHLEGESPLLLLAFVIKMMQAVQHAVQHRQLPGLMTASTEPSKQHGEISPSDLAVRLLSLSATALKVAKAASISAAAEPPSTVEQDAASLTSTPPDSQESVTDHLEYATAALHASSASLQNDDNKTAPNGYWPSYKEWLAIPGAVIEIAAAWDTVLCESGCNSVQHSMLPYAALLQAAAVYGAKISQSPANYAHDDLLEAYKQWDDGFKQSLRHPGDDGTALLVWTREEQEEYMTTSSAWDEALQCSVKAVALAQQAADVHHKLALAAETLEGVSLWVGDAVSLAATAASRHFSAISADKLQNWADYQQQCAQPLSRRLNKGSCSESAVLDSAIRGAAVKAGLAFAVPYCCNNPSCVNLSKLSEYQLVSDKACVCGGCKVARYCSKECQKKHWKQHKEVCRHDLVL